MCIMRRVNRLQVHLSWTFKAVTSILMALQFPKDTQNLHMHLMTEQQMSTAAVALVSPVQGRNMANKRQARSRDVKIRARVELVILGQNKRDK